ncbi:hypothetical protein PIB30_005488 [Stylosanthes scabra]|uniref:Aminotransferase-like plant mobile domain-containing protein n=1 Tax=Stylosanthes scabra TaxID=79078 RepID=A0ABU6Z1T2_9FABA|nr:hypothetical protein [Stylosanthes scabra]
MESFAIKMTWLRERLQHIPVQADPDTLRQYARCYIMLFIGGFLMPDKSGNLTYRSLYSASEKSTTDIAGCVPLILPWIYHRFPGMCPPDVAVDAWPLAERIDRLTWDEIRWTPYHTPGIQALIPNWIRSQGEVHTWRSAVPVVCFNYVGMHTNI